MIRILLLCFINLFISCNIGGAPKDTLSIYDSYKLKISEPSGITYFNNYLYIVSDTNGIIYRTDLKGTIVEEIKTGFKDLEGVAVDNSGELFVVSETKRILVSIEKLYETRKKFNVKGTQKLKNSGLEGLSFNPKNNTFYVVNEKAPKQILNISKKGKVLSTVEINFVKDLSGISIDDSGDSLWLLSDESQKIVNISKKGKLLRSYKIPVKKAEGIVVVKNKIYVVSDSQKKLYVFKKPN